MKNVDVSVVIPAYNVEKYIQKCVKSVLESSKSEIEVIVVDDNSSDDTLKKLRELIYLIGPKKIWMVYLNLLLSYSATVMFIILIAYIIEKRLPKVFSVLTGNRGNSNR